MGARFLHTSDWQLGMTRHFLSEEAQARFTQARFDAIRTLGRIAAQERCDFIVVCGDVFESNQVERRTVVRALEAVGSVPVPVFLLPGNHDPLNAASVFHSPTFKENRPSNVHVIEDTTAVEVKPGVEIAGAPWSTKRPLHDLVAAACSKLEPPHGATRVLLAHGIVDTLSPDRDNPALINLPSVEAAFTSGRIHYLALGDRHSLTSVGETGRVWYSGSPEPTDFDEVDPGNALLVEISPEGVSASGRRVGTWLFLKKDFDLAGDADLDGLETWLGGLDTKERSVLRLSFRGTLTLRQRARLDGVLERARDLFAAIEVSGRETDLVVIPSDMDFADLDLSGFARVASERLRAIGQGGDENAQIARDSLALLVRLARRNS